MIEEQSRYWKIKFFGMRSNIILKLAGCRRQTENNFMDEVQLSRARVMANFNDDYFSRHTTQKKSSMDRWNDVVSPFEVFIISQKHSKLKKVSLSNDCWKEKRSFFELSKAFLGSFFSLCFFSFMFIFYSTTVTAWSVKFFFTTSQWLEKGVYSSFFLRGIIKTDIILFIFLFF